ncbi:hypothetical protein NYP18_09140 [Corynebacterium sp. YIM 101645]|uniref:Phospholipase D-like domain-containing protein n=1 Tax=Corynebacterium lemuris TaxID=1859292 RepID=A0ABT2FZC7_9CORY|nr:hypothetical protein [Corynebacterium lemuris]MCS5479823.1 hypothetical protein [Corynebacterium lemuris]
MPNTGADHTGLTAALLALAPNYGFTFTDAQKKHLADLFAGIATIKPAAVLPRKGKSQARFSRAGIAAQSIAGLDQDTYVSGLTYGQFSLLDLIQAALDVTGPADVTVATWSSGNYDIEALKNFRDAGLIRRIRFIMDSGRQMKGQAAADDIAKIFGRDAIITVRTHTKFVLICNDDWDLVITSSMNLNKNIRLEHFEMTSDPAKVAMFTDVVGALFSEAPASGSYGRIMPTLRTIDPDHEVIAMPAVHRNRNMITMGKLNRPEGR